MGDYFAAPVYLLMLWKEALGVWKGGFTYENGEIGNLIGMKKVVATYRNEEPRNMVGKKKMKLPTKMKTLKI